MNQLLRLLLVCIMLVSTSLKSQDLYVIGSLGVGQDVNGTSFGFDTFVMKENNLRMLFDDTSASASFPANDWRFTFNDSSNGGTNYFAVNDVTAGTTPFTVAAGSGNNALYVSASGGNVGLGTASPVVELQVTDGDSPTLRLEQNGANGWTPQTWDIAGNETNFFIRDVTNGSKLPFKIRPGAPDNSLFVGANGDIALGNQAPTHKLDVDGSTDVRDDLFVGNQISVATATPDANASLDLAATDKGLLLNRLDNAGRAALGDALTTAATGAGMMIYDTEDAQTYFWNGTVWVNPATDDQNLLTGTLSGTTLTVAIENGTSVDVDLAPILVPLQDENAAQQAQIDDLLARVTAIEACACGGTLSTPEESSPLGNRISLDQNKPNPFSTTTSISYFIPHKYGKANMVIQSTLGQELFNIPITQFGEGTIELNKSSLNSAAVYLYTLFVDGKRMETKRLIAN